MKVKVQSADKLFDAVKHIKSGLESVKNGALEVGKWLGIIHKEKLWKADASPSRGFGQWVEMEIHISKAVAYAWIDAYDKFGKIIENNSNFREIDISKVQLLLPYVKEGMTSDEKEELLYMAQANTWRGLRDNLKEMRGKITTDNCEHSDQEMIARCRLCGKWIK